MTAVSRVLTVCSLVAASGVQSHWASVALRQEPCAPPLPDEDLRPQPCRGQVPLLVLRLPAEEDEEGVGRDRLLWAGGSPDASRHEFNLICDTGRGLNVRPVDPPCTQTQSSYLLSGVSLSGVHTGN